jgi:hypothetical protein
VVEALTSNDNEMALLPLLDVDTVNSPLYVPADSPVLGRTVTGESVPSPIEFLGNTVISKYVLPFDSFALTPVNAVFPVLLIITDSAFCVLYPGATDGNPILSGLIVHVCVDSGAAIISSWDSTWAAWTVAADENIVTKASRTIAQVLHVFKLFIDHSSCYSLLFTLKFNISLS